MLIIDIYNQADELVNPIDEKIRAEVKRFVGIENYTFSAYYRNALSRLSRAYAILSKILEAGENKKDLKGALDIAKLELKEFE